MQLGDAVRWRRMVRAFTDDPVDPSVIDGLLDLARRAPSAGHSQGWAFVVLEGPEQTARYWDITLPPARRPAFRWPGLVTAPVLIVALVRPDAIDYAASVPKIGILLAWFQENPAAVATLDAATRRNRVTLASAVGTSKASSRRFS